MISRDQEKALLEAALRDSYGAPVSPPVPCRPLVEGERLFLIDKAEEAYREMTWTREGKAWTDSDSDGLDDLYVSGISKAREALGDNPETFVGGDAPPTYGESPVRSAMRAAEETGAMAEALKARFKAGGKA